MGILTEDVSDCFACSWDPFPLPRLTSSRFVMRVWPSLIVLAMLCLVDMPARHVPF